MQPGLFRSYFGAIAVPALDYGDGRVANVTHEWAGASASIGGGLAVTMLRLFVRNKNVAQAKQELAEQAIAQGCQFIFFLDDDVIVPPDALMKMIQLWRMDEKYKIINGVYWSKSEPPLPLIFKGSFEGSFYNWHVGDLIEADAAGAGCTFIDTDVLKKLPKPWFSDKYVFQDIREGMDINRWQLEDELINLLRKGTLNKDEEARVAELQDHLKNQSSLMIEMAQTKGIDPTQLYNVKSAGGATEDLYFYKKAKEVLGLSCWVDTSIQCMHQDKTSGKIFGIRDDFPQAKRFKAIPEKGEKIVIDIGCGDYSPHFQEFKKVVRLDIDPAANPDILADARQIPEPDCKYDMVHASHILEHFSFKWTKNVLNEWIRILKIDGELVITVPNLEWAAEKIMRRKLGDNVHQEDMRRAMYMHYSAQKDGGKEDIHKAGFTPESMQKLLESLGCLDDIRVVVSDGIFTNYDDPGIRDGNYNIIAFAKKKKHISPISIHSNLNIMDQEMSKSINMENVSLDLLEKK